jgi:hypothetical protein
MAIKELPPIKLQLDNCKVSWTDWLGTRSMRHCTVTANDQSLRIDAPLTSVIIGLDVQGLVIEQNGEQINLPR